MLYCSTRVQGYNNSNNRSFPDIGFTCNGKHIQVQNGDALGISQPRVMDQ